MTALLLPMGAKVRAAGPKGNMVDAIYCHVLGVAHAYSF
jgi:hypothetical protein